MKQEAIKKYKKLLLEKAHKYDNPYSLLYDLEYSGADYRMLCDLLKNHSDDTWQEAYDLLEKACRQWFEDNMDRIEREWLKT